MNENARILLHPADSLLVPIDPSDVYYLEAVGGETLIRMRRSRPLKDVRPLGKLFPLFRRHGFLRVQTFPGLIDMAHPPAMVLSETPSSVWRRRCG